jgi:hypothetical protein
MNNKNTYIKEFGKAAYEKLDKRLKKIFEKIDNHPINKRKSFSHREFQEALK